MKKLKGIRMPKLNVSISRLTGGFLRRLDMYIIKKFLGTYIFAIALIISIAVVFDFNEKQDKFSSPILPTCSARCSCSLPSFSSLPS